MSETEPEAPFVLDNAELEKGSPPVKDLKEEEDYGFYVARNRLFFKRKFPLYPQSGYKPVFLNDLSDAVWYDFNRDVQHYQKYNAFNTWYYKLWTLVPTVWFLVMILPDLLWYYDFVVHGVGIICGVIMALAFSVDTYMQRRLLGRKIAPMYRLLADTYKARFMLHGYTLDIKLEKSVLDGVNAYLYFKRLPVGGIDDVASETLHAGFYVDEDFLGNKPYALGPTSNLAPPRFLTALDTDTWKNFTRDLEERTKTPPRYLLWPSFFMGLVIGLFAFSLVYSVVVFTAIRHWFLIVLFPLYGLVDIMRSFRRRHFIENVLVHSMDDLLKEYNTIFEKAGYRAYFDLEYILGYFALNTYITFQTAKTVYNVTPPASNAELTVDTGADEGA